MKELADIHLMPSYNLPDTYFIFRDNGVEVKVVIRNNMVLPSHDLYPEEMQHIRKAILQKGEKIIR